MATSTIEVINLVSQGATTLATIALAAFAYLALSQVGILRQQTEQQQKQSRATAVADQIRMFRKEIIPLFVEAATQIGDLKTNPKDFKIPVIEHIQKFDIGWLLENKTDMALAQHELSCRLESELGSRVWNSKQIDLLNAMEELAVRIKATETSSDPELASIRASFVNFVEICVWTMILSVNPYSPDSYPATRWLYSEWNAGVFRMPVETLQTKIREDIQKARNKIVATKFKKN